MKAPAANDAVQSNQAWIGDAVLALYARLKILREDGRVDGEKCKRLTSNQFLGTLAEPTKVEADVGNVFARDGLDAAFQWIDAHLLPLFERQEENRKRRNLVRPGRRRE
jgi:dsRNA-specific ribonuclease